MNYKLAILIVAFILLALWAVSVIILTWEKWEDKYYAKKIITDPERHSYCVVGDCRRPRPHKLMTYVDACKCFLKVTGWVCDKHFKLEE